MQQDLDELGRFESLPWGLPDTAAHVIRTLGGGRSLKKRIRAIDTIRDNSFAPVRSRMERWVSELESSTAAAREESIVFYRERDGRRTLKAIPHAGPATAAGGGIGPKDRVEPRDQVLHLAVGPLNELADVQNRSFTQPRPRMGADRNRSPKRW